jgi:hypothetical protein
MLQTATQQEELQMTIRLSLVLAAVATAALLPAAALGKEIKSVTITGPGLAHPIALKGGGRLDAGTPIGDLARTAPVVRRSSGSSMGVWAGGAAGVAALLLAIGYLVYRRGATALE